MKVDFMIIGAQKCGTSTLFNILSAHPDIVSCREKEPHFFSYRKDWRKDLKGYEQLYEQKNGVLYFEASTSYTFYPHGNFSIWNDLYEYNPHMKFIYIVRNPIERIVSSYMHAYQRGYTNLTIEKEIVENSLIFDVTRYYTQIKPYIERFGRNNVLLIDFDDFNKKKRATIQSISTFLGVEFEKFKNYENVHANISLGKNKKHYKLDNLSFQLKVLRRFFPSIWRNVSDNSKRLFKKKPALSRQYQKMIIHMLDSEIDCLARVMNKDLNHWKMVGDDAKQFHEEYNFNVKK